MRSLITEPLPLTAQLALSLTITTRLVYHQAAPIAAALREAINSGVPTDEIVHRINASSEALRTS